MSASNRPVIGSSVSPRVGRATTSCTEFTYSAMSTTARRSGASSRSLLAPVSGWDGVPPTTQKDDLDLLQGFGEVTLPVGSGALTLRAGRQEMSFGSSRLVSVRESPNIRRAFDGVRATFTASPDFHLDAFLARPVTPQAGTFDDGDDPSQLFGGIYSTVTISAVPGLKADIYYFGLERDVAAFAQGHAREERHTIGTRLFGTSGTFDYNVEAAYQFGSFGSADIRAWTASADLGYTLALLPFVPRIGLKADAIFGRRRPSRQPARNLQSSVSKAPIFLGSQSGGTSQSS